MGILYDLSTLTYYIYIYLLYTCIHATYYWFYITTIIPHYACRVCIIDTSGPIATEQLHGSKKGISQRLCLHNPGTYHQTLNQHLMKEFHSFWRFWGWSFAGVCLGGSPPSNRNHEFQESFHPSPGRWKGYHLPRTQLGRTICVYVKGKCFYIFNMCIFWGKT